MDLAQVLGFLGLKYAVSTGEFKTIQINSRQITHGDLFVAVPGLNTDGRDYISQAIQNGAAAVLVAAPYAGANLLHGIPVISVPDLKSKLAALAAFFYNYPARHLKIIGITGTNGKTSCSHYIAQILNAAHIPCGVMGTLGNGLLPNLTVSNLTTSDSCTVQQQFSDFKKLHTSCVAMEVSSHALVQGRLDGVPIDTAVFTNLSQDHLDYHQTMAEYFAAKTQLFTAFKPKHAVINLDDAHAEQLLKLIAPESKILTYALNNPQADIYMAGNTVHTPWGTGVLQSHLIGKFNLSNVLACIAVCACQGLDLAKILTAVKNLLPVAGRMQKAVTAATDMPSVVIDYAHTPDALIKALQAVRESVSSQAKVYCVFGCGGDRDRSKRPLMLKAVLAHSDQVIITQDNPRTEDPQQIVNDMLVGIDLPDNIHIQLDRATAIQQAIAAAKATDIVLIAGKGHEDYQIIGTQKFPFSDLLIAEQALAIRGKKHG